MLIGHIRGKRDQPLWRMNLLHAYEIKMIKIRERVLALYAVVIRDLIKEKKIKTNKKKLIMKKNKEYGKRGIFLEIKAIKSF